MNGNPKILQPLFAGLFLLLSLARISVVSARSEFESADENPGAITRKQISPFTVIGIEARTDNRREAGGAGVIPGQWQKFFSEDIPAKIPGKTGPTLYAIYARYSSRRNGEYNYVVAAPVKDSAIPPPGLVKIRVPGGDYAVFTTAKGPLAKVIPAEWQRIWKLEDEGKLRRTYQTDFEVHDERAQDPQNAEVDIYVGVR